MPISFEFFYLAGGTFWYALVVFKKTLLINKRSLEITIQIFFYRFWPIYKTLTSALTVKRLGEREREPPSLSPQAFGGRGWSPSLWFFQKCFFWREGDSWFFVTFYIIICHIFPDNFTEVSDVFQKIGRFSSSTLTTFINFSIFLTFPWWKTNDATCNRWCQHFFIFNRLYIRWLSIV